MTDPAHRLAARAIALAAAMLLFAALACVALGAPLVAAVAAWWGGWLVFVRWALTEDGLL